MHRQYDGAEIIDKLPHTLNWEKQCTSSSSERSASHTVRKERVEQNNGACSMIHDKIASQLVDGYHHLHSVSLTDVMIIH